MLLRVSMPLRLDPITPEKIDCVPGWPEVRVARLGDGTVVTLVNGVSPDGKWALAGSSTAHEFLGGELREAEEALLEAEANLKICQSRVKSARERLSAHASLL